MTAVLLDVDGTLVDSNYHHVLAWLRAFHRRGIDVPAWRVHRSIGMGSDRLVAEVAGREVEDRHGDELRAAWAEEFAPLLEEVRPVQGAHELLRSLRDLGLVLVLASSGRAEHVERYVQLLRAAELLAAWTTSQDAPRTKPAPDLLEVARERSGESEAVVVGDSTWDVLSARRLGLRCYGVLTGGFGREELLMAGAVDVVERLAELERPLATGVAA
jgi:HAD superfamily hydrolase (TIGR01549 family)